MAPVDIFPSVTFAKISHRIGKKERQRSYFTGNNIGLSVSLNFLMMKWLNCPVTLFDWPRACPMGKSRKKQTSL